MNRLIIDSFHITWWLWKPVQLDGHLYWLRFDTSWYLNNCTCSCIVHWHGSFRSRGIKMESIKVAIQLHWFLWPPRYVKLVYRVTALQTMKLQHSKRWSAVKSHISVRCVFRTFILLKKLLNFHRLQPQNEFVCKTFFSQWTRMCMEHVWHPLISVELANACFSREEVEWVKTGSVFL